MLFFSVLFLILKYHYQFLYEFSFDFDLIPGINIFDRFQALGLINWSSKFIEIFVHLIQKLTFSLFLQQWP